MSRPAQVGVAEAAAYHDAVRALTDRGRFGIRLGLARTRALLKALIRQDANVSRCQLRGGVHMEQGYVNDVCLTPRFNQCVFYEDELTRE